MRSQRVVAQWFAERGWPFAESTGAGRSGVDVTGLPGLSCEVKARTELQPQAWLRQADREGGVPFVVFRLNGVGEAQVGNWGVMMRLSEFTKLLHSAGYGTPELSEQDLNDRNDEGDRAHGEQADGGNTEDQAHPAGDPLVYPKSHGTQGTPA